MTVAVLSDIHSNYHAFKACFDDAVKSGADSFIFLGDYISDLAEPQATLDLVYQIQSMYPAVCLRGNRERYMLDCESGGGNFVRGSKTGSLLFTYDHLRKKDLDFFRGLKISDTVVIGGVRMEIAHAAMDNDRYYFDSNDGHTAEIFPQMKCDYFLTGHSHKQYIQRNSGKTIINPGSVGIPQGGTRNPKYALLDIANGSVSCQLREVPYDMADAIHSQFANGLVDYAKYWAIGVLYDMITGEELVLKILRRVQETGDFNNEELWHSSAISLGMKLTEQEILAVYQEMIAPKSAAQPQTTYSKIPKENDMLYHVSPIQGITVLTPRVSTHGKAYVYAIDDLVTGLLFGAKHDDFDFSLSTNEAGTPQVYECYPDAFRCVYQGKKCSVYEVKDDGFLRGITSWNPELVCESEVPVEKETVITDLFSRLLLEESDGNLILHRYNDTPEYKRIISEHIVDRLIRFDAMKCLDTDVRFQRYYSGIIGALNSIMDGHLLIHAPEHPDYTVIPYDEKYRDDMIFMVLEAKDALGRVPRLNEDLLDIQKSYLDTGDSFWLAIDENDRVIGCIGYNSIPGTTEVKLHRLYVKAARKRQGIGTHLLHTAEQHLRQQGKTAAHVHLGGREYFESRSFYPKHGYQEYTPGMMKKEL